MTFFFTIFQHNHQFMQVGCCFHGCENVNVWVYLSASCVMIDRGACWRLPEPELHPLYEAAASMSKSEYGDLVSVFTTWGSGSTATMFTPQKTGKTFPFCKRIMESQGNILKTWEGRGDRTGINKDRFCTTPSPKGGQTSV